MKFKETFFVSKVTDKAKGVAEVKIVKTGKDKQPLNFGLKAFGKDVQAFKDLVGLVCVCECVLMPSDEYASQIKARTPIKVDVPKITPKIPGEREYDQNHY